MAYNSVARTYGAYNQTWIEVFIESSHTEGMSRAPCDCFLYNICLEKQILPWPFHSCTIFETYVINSLRFSEAYFFTFPSYAVFRRQRKPKIFGFKNVIERGVTKILTFVKEQIVSKIFGKIILKVKEFDQFGSSVTLMYKSNKLSQQVN